MPCSVLTIGTPYSLPYISFALGCSRMFHLQDCRIPRTFFSLDDMDGFVFTEPLDPPSRNTKRLLVLHRTRAVYQPHYYPDRDVASVIPLTNLAPFDTVPAHGQTLFGSRGQEHINSCSLCLRHPHHICLIQSQI